MYKYSDVHQAYREGFGVGWEKAVRMLGDSAAKLKEIDRLTLGFNRAESPQELYEIVQEIRKITYSQSIEEPSEPHEPTFDYGQDQPTLV